MMFLHTEGFSLLSARRPLSWGLSWRGGWWPPDSSLTSIPQDFPGGKATEEQLLKLEEAS
jgi:hypothetical protein